MNSQKEDRQNLLDTNEIARIWVEELQAKIEKDNKYIKWLDNEFRKLFEEMKC